ncbi:unnamed protein product [Effrenium voratum]|uniref:Uncharacterized protein n=1 Tax=Effrenium voratum TaxID=2562239 RepID=A0AA36JRZ4_9DINO|nr:unnamed protein product [Effrenium voratum]
MSPSPTQDEHRRDCARVSNPGICPSTGQRLQPACRSFLQTFYPSFDTWHWRRTASYWIAISFAEGSLLFTLGSWFGYAGDCGWHVSVDHRVNASIIKALSIWPSLFGSVFFSFGAYLMCLESMNVMRAAPEWDFGLFNFRSIMAYLDSCNAVNKEITRTPYFASFSYFVGTSIYPIALVTNLWEHISSDVNLIFCTIPYTLGGICFLAGGVLECVENEVFTRAGIKAGITIPKCAAAMNFLGGVLFALGGAILFWPDSSRESNLLFTIGSVFYTIGASLSVILWKDEQFGLAYLAALNHISGQARGVSFMAANSPRESRAFSVRGIVFIHLYCMVSVVAVMNFCLALNHFIAMPNLFTLTRAGNEFLPFLLLHLVLLLHSAVVKTPRTQPFHASWHGRCVAFVLSCVRGSGSLSMCIARVWGFGRFQFTSTSR